MEDSKSKKKIDQTVEGKGTTLEQIVNAKVGEINTKVGEIIINKLEEKLIKAVEEKLAGTDLDALIGKKIEEIIEKNIITHLNKVNIIDDSDLNSEISSIFPQKGRIRSRSAEKVATSPKENKFISLSPQYQKTLIGILTIEFFSVDYIGTMENPNSIQVKIDTINPITYISLTGTAGSNGFFISPATVTLTSFDDPTGSGVKSISYRVDGGIWQAYSDSFIIRDDGYHLLEAYGIDNAGNVESPPKSVQIKIDLTKPTTDVSLAGNLGRNNWYISAVTVFLTSTDGNTGSGISSVRYRLDESAYQISASPTVSFKVEHDGEHILEVSAVDKAGNIENPKLIAFKIDINQPLGSNANIIPRFVAYDNYSDVIKLEIYWSDKTSGIVFVVFWYEYSNNNLWLGPFDPVRVATSTFWFEIPRTEWIQHLGATIRWKSEAMDKAGNNGTFVTEIPLQIMDDDTSSPVYISHIDTSLYGLLVSAQDVSGWRLYAQYNFSKSPGIVYDLWNQTFRINFVNLSVTIPESQLIVHIGEYIGWRFLLADLDNDRLNDNSTTPWFSWTKARLISDTIPPNTNFSVSGIIGKNGWYRSAVIVTLIGLDSMSKVNYTKFRINNGIWDLYLSPVNFLNDGTFILEFFSTDQNGNAEPIQIIKLMIDKTAPQVDFSFPVNASQNISLDTIIVIFFNEEMDRPSTERAISISAGITIQSYIWNGNRELRLVLAFPLEPQKNYTVTISGAEDIAGNILNYAWTFSTRSESSAPNMNYWILVLLIVVVFLMGFLIGRRRKVTSHRNSKQSLRNSMLEIIRK